MPHRRVRSLYRLLLRTAALSLLQGPAALTGYSRHLPPHDLDPSEKRKENFIHLLSAIDHLQRGVAWSKRNNENYLWRLEAASPEDRLRALEHYGCTLVEYNMWQKLYGKSPAPYPRRRNP